VPSADRPSAPELCTKLHGFSLHAAVRWGTDQRKELEHLYRYITRPAIANERLKRNRAGDVVLQLKSAFKDGTTHIVMAPLEFMQRLAALVPRPRLHLIRFHGVLAPNAKLRSEIIPSPVEQATEPACDHAQAQGAPATFNEIYEHLGPHVKQKWDHAVVPLSQGFVSKGAYCEALDVFRPALQKRYEDSFRSNGIEGLIYPTTPTVAPKVSEGEYTVAGKVLDTRTIGKNAYASSCAGLPGISLPMELSSDGLPIGLEIDGQPNSDSKLLDLATRISRILGSIPPPSN
jgi:Asp-tRNA(Asn)/Glu-tRNA(Gln) amidotransferase A subunit family amidase